MTQSKTQKHHLQYRITGNIIGLYGSNYLLKNGKPLFNANLNI